LIRKLIEWNARVNWSMGILSVVALFIMVMITTIDIIGRFFFKHGVNGALEVNEFMLVAAGFLALAHAQSKRAHVQLDLFYDRLPKRWKFLISTLSYILVLAFNVFFLVTSVAKAVEMTRVVEVDWAGSILIPVWPVRWLVPLGVFLLCVQLAIDLGRNLKSWAKGEDLPA
jgi:TRAP-type transport system small permease protein